MESGYDKIRAQRELSLDNKFIVCMDELKTKVGTNPTHKVVYVHNNTDDLEVNIKMVEKFRKEGIDAVTTKGWTRNYITVNVTSNIVDVPPPQETK